MSTSQTVVTDDRIRPEGIRFVPNPCCASAAVFTLALGLATCKMGCCNTFLLKEASDIMNTHLKNLILFNWRSVISSSCNVHPYTCGGVYHKFLLALLLMCSCLCQLLCSCLWDGTLILSMPRSGLQLLDLGWRALSNNVS